MSNGSTRRVHVVSRGRSRRATDWNFGPGGETVGSIISSALTIVGAGVGPFTDAPTLVRTRGALSLYLSGITSALDGFVYAFGLAVVTAQVFNAGAASMPDPFDDSSWDGWLFHHFGSVFSPEAALNSGGGMSFERVVVDSKAMRKLGDNNIIAGLLSTTEVGAATMKVQFDSRILLKVA